MAEIVTTFQHLVTFSTYTGTNGRPMAQITLAGDHAGIPTEELDRMCAEWCTSRGVVAWPLDTIAAVIVQDLGDDE